MSNAKREGWIDSVKGIAIFMVVIVHFMPLGIIEEYLHMVALEPFFVVYGYCAVGRNDFAKLKETIVKRFVSLVIPYIIWAMIFDSHSVKNLINIAWGTNYTLVEAGSSGVLWYLPSFFVAVVAFEVILYLSKGNKKVVLALSGLSFLVAAVLFYLDVRNLPWGINVSALIVCFMSAGYLAKRYINRERTKKISVEIGKIVLCVLGLVSGFSAVNMETDKGYVQVARADYGNIFVFYLSCLAVALSIMFIARRLSEIDVLKPLNRFIGMIGMNSFMIMILHRDFVVYYDKVLSVIGIENSNFIATVSGIVVVIVSCYMGKIVMKYAPILAGKR